MSGMLYLCATPIGNLDDITIRVLDVLNRVSSIYAEDTRHSSILLEHHGIRKPLISCHEHNEALRADEIADRVTMGQEIAYISDAGMPCICDPGERLIARFIELGLPYTVLPGPSASVTALALSGLSTDRFYFHGFISRTGSERHSELTEILSSTVTAIVYESPHRVLSTLEDMRLICGGERRVSLVREITKVYEESVCGSLDDMIEHCKAVQPRGEYVILISGVDKVSNEITDDEILRLIGKGLTTKQVVKTLCDLHNLPRNEVYDRVLRLKDGLG